MSKNKWIKVLMITDEENDVSLVREILHEGAIAHYEIESANSYEEGMARLKLDQHDACLLDFPGNVSADGLTVLRTLARQGCRVPIIIMTGESSNESNQEALDAGAVDYLDKSELQDNILERSAAILERSIRYATRWRNSMNALRNSQERLIEADLRRDELLAMLAHELRNPLSPIRYALQSLRLHNHQDAQFQRQRELIDRQVRQMARLLDDLLDVTRMTRGKIHLQKEKLDLGDIVAKAVDEVRPLINEYHLELVFTRSPGPLWIEGDAGRLEQSLRNVMYNAVKFTKAGGRIWVNAEHEDGEAPAAVVRIADTGIGMDSEMLPRVFDLFTQIDQSLNRAQGGLGIGLTLVKHLVRMHGGTVQAQSEGPGKGSEFEIRLPLAELTEMKSGKPQPAKGEMPTARKTPAVQGRMQRVLVVEDNLDSANSLAELIGLWGHETRVVNDGPAAIEAATDFQPDVVLLDIGLPGMNGYQVARVIRSRPALKEALLVALTGFGQDEDRRLAELSGFDRHFTKPVEVEALQSLLERAAA